MNFLRHVSRPLPLLIVVGALATFLPIVSRSNKPSREDTSKVNRENVDTRGVIQKKLDTIQEELGKASAQHEETAARIIEQSEDPNLALQDENATQATAENEKGTIVIDGRDFVDPNAVERIENMNIPQELKQEILANYKRTGILPSVLEKPTREPAAETAKASATATSN